MKKFGLILVLFVCLFIVSSCNYNCIDVKWQFNYAYIVVGDETIEVEVDSWAEQGEEYTIVEKGTGQVYMSSKENVLLTKYRKVN